MDARQAFVGRQHEISLLKEIIEKAGEGTSSLVMVEGAAGIGKTRLAEQAAGIARLAGMDVFWGRCWEGEGAPVFWPWIQMIRSLSRRREPAELLSIMGAGASDIVQIVPELREQMPDLRSLPETFDPDQARFRLFDSIGQLLRCWTTTTPALLIVDDAHWADLPSLKLLQFLSQEVDQGRLVVVVAYRDDTVRQRSGVAEVMAGLSRLRVSARLRLSGLDCEDVAQLVSAAIGADAPDGLASRMFTETEGNPLFLTELLRSFVADRTAGDGRTIKIPPNLREMIVHRLRHLSSECVRAVQACSVAGRECDIRVIRRAVSSDDVLRSIEEACRAGILEVLTGVGIRYRFTHGLVREAIYEQIDEPERRLLHLGIARAIENVNRGELDGDLSALSFHFFSGLPDGDVDKAVRYAIRAAERATRLLAHEEAAEHYRRALIAERARVGDWLRRCDILVALGYALTRAGDLGVARDTFAQAVLVAREAEAGEQLAHAALGICGLFPATRGADEELLHLLEEVLDSLDGSLNGLHARVLAAASTALQFSWPAERRIGVSERALMMARCVGDIRAEMQALDAYYYALLSPSRLKDRLVAAQDLIRLAETVGDREMALRGHCHVSISYLEANNIAAADIEIDLFDKLAMEVRQPAYQWQVIVLRAMRALLGGSFDEARDLAGRARTMGEKFSDSRALLVYWAQEVWQRRELGTLDAMSDVALRPGSIAEASFPWDGAVALLLSELDRNDEARRLLSIWRDREIPDDAFLLATLSLFAAAACMVEDVEFARGLYRKLEPYEGRGVIPGLGGCIFLGCVDLYLGMLAGVMNECEVASWHLANALGSHRESGAPCLVARTQVELGRVAIKRGRWLEAVTYLNEAIAGFDLLGMSACLRRAQQLVAIAMREGGDAGVADGVANARFNAACHKEGEYWAITFAGRTTRHRNVRGFEYIAYLLARANQPVSALDLAVLGLRSGDEGMSGGAARQDALRDVDFGGEGPVLDERARVEYRARLRELGSERDDAVRFNDYGRINRIESEIDAIQTHLTAGVRLGGRSRRWTSPAERARVNVRNSIATALRAIARQHEPLYRHLQNSIKTGAVCSYVPEQPVSWQITA